MAPDAAQLSDPVVTVVTPTVNRLELLREAMLSVRIQRGVTWEHIVIDDASEDGTGEWLEHQADPRLRVIRMPERRERCAARNLGTERARGRYVLFLDHDDRLAPGALAYLSGLLDSYPQAVAAAGSMLWFDETNSGLPWGVHPFRYGDLLFEVISIRMVLPSGSTMFRKEVVAAAGGWDDRYIGIEDGEFSMRALALGPAVMSPRLVVEHRAGSTLYHPERVQADRMLLQAQHEAVERLDGARRAEAEAMLAGFEELMRAKDAISERRPLTVWRRTLAGVSRAPRYWLGRGVKTPVRIAWRGLMGVPLLGWVPRATKALAFFRKTHFVPWDVRVRQDAERFRLEERRWRARRRWSLARKLLAYRAASPRT